MAQKKVVILGSTGSIGINTLKVIERYPELFKVVGLTAYSNVSLVERQIKKFKPAYAALTDKGIQQLKKSGRVKSTKLLNVDKDLEHLVALKNVDVVVIGMRGSAALGPFLSAVRAGKTVAPANKEALVIAGDLIMKEARRHKAVVIPVDSEQSAIFQCLQGQRRDRLSKIHLTASGGALLNVPRSKFNRLTVEEILRHPRWRMGAKITVDSALLMNKGFEVIEAQRLFALDIDQIEVIVHPEAIIHSMVEFVDGSVIAQLGVTDMRLPIQYALTYPDRMDTGLKAPDFSRLKAFHFQKPDVRKFPSLSLAIHVARCGGTLPSVLNAADEEAVEAFLKGKISFTQIYTIVEKVVLKHKNISRPSLKAILQTDQWAREQSQQLISG